MTEFAAQVDAVRQAPQGDQEAAGALLAQLAVGQRRLGVQQLAHAAPEHRMVVGHRTRSGTGLSDM